MTTAVDVSGLDDAPILIDQFLDAATELDVDVVADFGNAPEVPKPSSAASWSTSSRPASTPATPPA
jgi:hypothetical protein